MTLINSLFPKLSAKFASKKVAKVVENVAPKIQKAADFRMARESILGTKPLDIKVIRDLEEDIYQNNILVKNLKDASAPENLVLQARNKFPLKYDKKTILPKSYNDFSKKLLKNTTKNKCKKY